MEIRDGSSRLAIFLSLLKQSGLTQIEHKIFYIYTQNISYNDNFLFVNWHDHVYS